MRARGKTDANHAAVVKMLRSCGISVCDLSAVGNGCPDLLCGRNGANVLIEVKDGAKDPSARKLTVDQAGWHARWAGQVAIANSPDEAVDIVLRAAKELEA